MIGKSQLLEVASSLYCDLFAPGAQIASVVAPDGVGIGSGTSFAVPYVAGAAALIMSRATHLTALEVKELIMNTVVTSSVFEDKCVSGGRLSISSAIYALFEEYRGAYSLGDLDGNGYVDSNDLSIARDIYFEEIEPSEQQLFAADIDGDGEVTFLDCLEIQRFCARTTYFAP